MRPEHITFHTLHPFGRCFYPVVCYDKCIQTWYEQEKMLNLDSFPPYSRDPGPVPDRETDRNRVYTQLILK